MKRALVLLAVVGCVSACGSASRPAATNDWRIGFGRRLGAVRMGEREARVDAELGPGVQTHLGNYSAPMIFYRQAELYVVYYRHDGQKYAIALITRSPRYRTAAGSGVGTTLAQLRKRGEVTCDGDGFVHGKLKYPSSDPDQCSHDPANFNDPFTAFTMDYETKRVTQVAIFPGGD